MQPYSRRSPARKLLREMTRAELVAWLDHSQAALAEHSEFVQQYLDRRARGGRHTRTDEQYSKFQDLAADLLAALDEMRQAAEQENP